MSSELISDDDVQPYQSRSEDELKNLAKAMFRNDVFIATDSEKVRIAFSMCIAFADQKCFDQLERDAIVAWYEFYNDPETGRRNHTNRSVNGLPMFTSARFLNREDYLKTIDYVERLQMAEAKALEG